MISIIPTRAQVAAEPPLPPTILTTRCQTAAARRRAARTLIQAVRAARAQTRRVLNKRWLPARLGSLTVIAR